MKKLICFIVSVFIAAECVPPLSACCEETDGHIGIVLAEADSGTVLYESRSHERMPCGSLCKLMTLLLTAESMDRGEISRDDILTASERANSMQGAQIWLMPGEKMSLGDLLAAVVIGNANDAAVVIAEAVSGSEDRFAENMNSRAAELGMKDTRYKNASGYLADGAYTTAYDTALLMAELSHHDDFDDLYVTRLAYLKDGEVQLVNSNPAALKINGSAGFKAGMTGEKESLRYYAAEGARRNGECYIAAVIGSPDEDYASARARELLEYGFSAFETVFPDLPDDMPRDIAVSRGRSEKLRVRVSGLRRMVISRGSSGKITSRTAFPDYVYAPVGRNGKVGEILYFYGGKYAFSADIRTVGGTEKKTVKYVMFNMLKNIFEL